VKNTAQHAPPESRQRVGSEMCPDSLFKIVWFGDRIQHEEYVLAQNLEDALARWRQIERAMPGDARILSIAVLKVHR